MLQGSNIGIEPKNKLVRKAFIMLRAFHGAEEGLTSQELRQRARLPKASGHRLIQTLEDIGAVMRGPDGRYRLGMTLVSLSHDVAVDELRWLVGVCSEFVEAHALLGELALAEGDAALARGHFGFAVQLGLKALQRANVSGGVLKVLRSNLARNGRFCQPNDEIKSSRLILVRVSKFEVFILVPLKNVADSPPTLPRSVRD